MSTTDDSGSNAGNGEHETESPGSETPAIDDETAEEPPGFSGLSGFGTMGALSGFGELFGQARDQLEKASHDAADVTVTGRAGGGAVEIELTGNLEANAVRIAPDVVDAADIGMLEDLVLAALRDALTEVNEIRDQAASSLLPPGLDLGAMMSSLFGGAGPTGEGSGPSGAGIGAIGGLAGSAGMPDLNELMSELFGGEAPGSEPDDDFDDGLA